MILERRILKEGGCYKLLLMTCYLIVPTSNLVVNMDTKAICVQIASKNGVKPERKLHVLIAVKIQTFMSNWSWPLCSRSVSLVFQSNQHLNR